MKVAINRCYGGFNLSVLGIQRLAALQGRECHFYTQNENEDIYLPISLDDAMHTWSFAFDVANINDVLPFTGRAWQSLTPEELEQEDKVWRQHQHNMSPENRSDPLLIQMLEELGDAGVRIAFSKVEIVEIPDGIEYYIDEGDGYEVIHEKHRTWC